MPETSDCVPFLSDGVNNGSFFNDMIINHMNCIRLKFRGDYRRTGNHYDSHIGTQQTAFHITFYEKLSVDLIKHPKMKEDRSWVHGPLYDEDISRLAESSFTVRKPPQAFTSCVFTSFTPIGVTNQLCILPVLV